MADSQKAEPGQPVQYFNHDRSGTSAGVGPFAAIITKVVDPGQINIVGFTPEGNSHGESNVKLVAPGEDAPVTGAYCKVMTIDAAAYQGQQSSDPRAGDQETGGPGTSESTLDDATRTRGEAESLASAENATAGESTSDEANQDQKPEG